MMGRPVMISPEQQSEKGGVLDAVWNSGERVASTVALEESPRRLNPHSLQ